MISKPVKGETRTMGELREHYEIEKELASRLRNASKEERRSLYASLYDEIYRRVPLHPQLTQKASPEQAARVVALQMKFLERFLDKDDAFLELGPGDCSLSFEVAGRVKQAVAVDVSGEITKSATQPANFQLFLSDGSSVPVPPESVDVAFSDQLMEHLHPDDAFEQLENICRALVPGGVYVCVTPNRLRGPHDISMYFDDTATGLHLKEYTNRGLAGLFRKAGFSRVRVYAGARGKFVRLPAWPVALCEMLLDLLPHALKRRIARSLPFRIFLGIRMVGIK